MSYSYFYRYIYKYNDDYWIIKNNEWYLSFPTLEEALFERDRLIAVDWDWELYCELPSTINNYIHLDLPPFEHKPKYIVTDRENWVVRGKGRNGKYYGTYYTEEEAEEIRLIHNGRKYHYPQRYRVQKRIDGRSVTFGYFKTLKEAEEEVLRLKENDWRKT